MKTAKLIKDNLEGFAGHASLYELSPPMKNEKRKHKFVVCSTAHPMFSDVETYIFPANKKGEVISWGDLDGSQKGTTSHEVVLNNAGYTLIK